MVTNVPTTPEGDVHSGGGVCVRVGGGGGRRGVWEISVLSAQFGCEPKTTLPKKMKSEFFLNPVLILIF